MAIGIQNYPNINPASSEFLSGSIRDKTSSQEGTPVNSITNGDIQEFFSKILSLASIAPTGIPDNEYSGHQYISAMVNLIGVNASTDIITGILKNYINGQVVILWGCQVTANIPGTSSISAGAIFYNGQIYKVAANNNIIVSSPQTLVYTINTAMTPPTIQLVSGLSGSGIANYNSASIINLISVLTNNILSSQSGNAGLMLTTNGTTPSWSKIGFDRQGVTNYSYGGVLIPEGAPSHSIVGSSGSNPQCTITTASGSNRNYIISAVLSLAEATTTPTITLGLYKNGTMIAQTQYIPAALTTISLVHIDANVPQGTVYTLETTSSDGNQVHCNTYSFIIDGVPSNL